MKKYHFSICLILLISINTSLHAQTYPWENISNQIPGDSTNNLSDVSVPSRWIGFISSGSVSEIYKSDFWTGTWETIQTPSPVNAFDFQYYDRGLMCGNDSTVYQTTDYGESWTYFGFLGEKINDIDLSYDIYNLKGYVCSDNGTIGLIEDTNLVEIQSGYSTNFAKISFPYNDKAWIVGDSSVYLYDGNTFTKQFTSTTALNSIYFWNEFYGLIVGDSGYIARTTDGGNTWVQKQNPDTFNRDINDVYLVRYFGFAVGDNGLVLETIDAGETWTMTSGQLTTNDITAVHISGGSVEWGPGLAAGENKTALLYPVVVSVDEGPFVIDKFYLYQNYPNPFNPSTKIKYEIPASLNPSKGGTFKNISLKIYDILGKEVAVLVNQEQDAGIYEIIFNAANLSAGVYFYQLKADGFIATKKLVLLK